MLFVPGSMCGARVYVPAGVPRSVALRVSYLRGSGIYYYCTPPTLVKNSGFDPPVWDPLGGYPPPPKRPPLKKRKSLISAFSLVFPPS